MSQDLHHACPGSGYRALVAVRSVEVAQPVAWTKGSLRPMSKRMKETRLQSFIFLFSLARVVFNLPTTAGQLVSQYACVSLGTVGMVRST